MMDSIYVALFAYEFRSNRKHENVLKNIWELREDGFQYKLGGCN